MYFSPVELTIKSALQLNLPMLNLFKQKHPLFLYSAESFSLLARIGEKKNTEFPIHSIEEFNGGTASENLKLGIEKSFNIVPKTPPEAICSISPLNRFTHRAKLELKLKKQGIAAFGALLKERFAIELTSNKVAVLNAQDGMEVSPKNIPDNVCFVGAPKKELQEAQSVLLKNHLYPQRLYLSTLTGLGGLLSYVKAKKIDQPILFVDLSLLKSHILILKNGGVEATYPLAYGLKNLIALARKEYNLPDDIGAHKYLTQDIQANSEDALKLTNRISTELKSYVGFFEVQTGQPLTYLFFNALPTSLAWIEEAVAHSMNLQTLEIDFPFWLKTKSLSLGDNLIKQKPWPRHWFGLFSLIFNHFS